MPTEDNIEQLEWSEENLSRVISEIYAKAVSDKTFHDELMADPYAVLNARIKVPDEYTGRVFAREAKKRMLILNVPPYVEQGESRTTALPEADYQIICTIFPPW